MTLETSFGIVTILIAAAALGGYMLSQIKQAALLQEHQAADRTVILHLREAVRKAEEDAQQLAEDLDHCIRQLHLYEQAWHGQPSDGEQDPTGDPILATSPSEAAPVQFDEDVLQDVEPEIGLEENRDEFTVREIA